ncbi:MAG: hypothetical protein LBH31_02210 [Burkholderiaceae bacterium]|jgi:hypothetical protein|nr:hypothetical protein [Burkholderiaceae bacterium]
MNNPAVSSALPAQKKSLMRRALGWFGWMVLVLFVLLAATFAYYRLRGPTAEQQAALALMRKDYRPAHGVNAFPLLLYWDDDLPLDRLNARMSADVEQVRKRLAAGEQSSETSTDAQPELPEAEITALCGAHRNACLAQATVHPDAVRAVLAAHAIVVRRAKAFERTDFLWNEFPPLSSPPILGAMDEQTLWLSAFALQYAEGDRLGALAATCRNLAAWRRIARGSNRLLSTVLASGNMANAIRLYADMLAGLPADAAVPEDCAQALQPVAVADVDRCAAMAGEFTAQPDLIFHVVDKEFAKATGWRLVFVKAIFDLRTSQAQTAQPYAASCTQAALARLLADERPRHQSARLFLGVVPVLPGMKGAECIANLFGCFIMQPALLPDFAKCDTNILEHATRLRLAATLLWLRHPPSGSVAQAFAHRPAELRSPNHMSGFDAQRGVLYVENLRRASSDNPDRQRLELPVASPR